MSHRPAPRRVREVVTRRGQPRGAGTVDLVVAAAAGSRGLALPHRDRDFECVTAVTGRALRWYGPGTGG